MSNCNNHNCSNSIYVSGSETRGAIQASNNKARYYAELAEQYKNEAKELRDDAQYYAEQNSDVTKTYVDGIDSALRNLIATKQNSGNYALEDELPTKLSELQNDTSFVNSTELQNAVDSVLPSTTNKVGVLSFDGDDMDWEDISGEILAQVAQDLAEKMDLDGTNILSAESDFINQIICWGMPDYSSAISATDAYTVNNKFTAPCDGILIYGYWSTHTCAFYVNDHMAGGIYGQSLGYGFAYPLTIPLSKNDTFYQDYANNGAFPNENNKFVPLKGVSQ